MLNLKLRWKLMATYIILVAFVLIITAIMLRGILGSSTYERISHRLNNEALIVKEYLDSELQLMEFSYSLDPIIDSLSQELGVRITVVSIDGEVLADSGVGEKKLLKLERHDTRPEIVQALQKGFGKSRRYSNTLKKEMLYIAYPLGKKGNYLGAVRLALPLKEIEQIYSETNKTIYIVSFIGFMISIIIGFIVSLLITKPIKSITRMAEDVAAGQLDRRTRITTGDEIQTLSETLNEMTDQLKEKIDQITEERDKLNGILEGMVEGVMMVDAHGNLVMVNSALKKIFSISRDITGKTPIEVIRNSDLQDAFDSIQRGDESVTKEITTIYGQKEKTLVVQVVALKRGDKLHGAVGVLHDISKIKRLENIRKDFVANVSHELKTPLSAIIGYSETLLAKDLSEDKERQKEFTEIIHSHATRLGNIVEDLLKISEIEAGCPVLDLTDIEIKGIVERTALILEKEIKEKKLDLTIEFPESIPRVKAGENALEQVFLNLLDNAIKYTPDNGKIEIRASEENDFVKIEVSDTGVGIPAKDLSRIFERFYRVDKARSREIGGTGLGLSIVKHLVESMGGRVWAESRINKGSTFFFTLPKI